jgi:hypothetical protein
VAKANGESLSFLIRPLIKYGAGSPGTSLHAPALALLTRSSACESVIRKHASSPEGRRELRFGANQVQLTKVEASNTGRHKRSVTARVTR